MNKPWKVILAFLGVFLAGAVFGGFISLRMARERFFKEPPMDRFTSLVLRRFSDRLELTPEQEQQIRPIVMATEVELRRVRSSGFKETVTIAEKMNEQISELLTPEQREKLEQLKQEMSERWRRDRPGRNFDGNRLPPPGTEDYPLRPPGPNPS